MRRSSCLLASVLAAGFLAAGARPAAACSCAGSQSPCQAFATSSIVFVGEVLSVERAGDDFHMRLRVVRALKGIEAATADLWSNANTSCGVKLDQGRALCHLHVPDRAAGCRSMSAATAARSRPANPIPSCRRCPDASTGASRGTTSIGSASSDRSSPSPRSASRSIARRAGSPRPATSGAVSSSRTCRPARTSWRSTPDRA